MSIWNNEFVEVFLKLSGLVGIIVSIYTMYTYKKQGSEELFNKLKRKIIVVGILILVISLYQSNEDVKKQVDTEISTIAEKTINK